MRYVVFPLSAALLVACGDGKGDAAKAMVAEADSMALATSSVQVIDLSKYNLPLLFTAPDKQLTNGVEPNIVWREEVGKLEITAGEHFGLNITEQPADIARLKADLERDQLKTNTLIHEAADLVEYRSQFPDDPSLVFIHFYKVVQAGTRTFIVEDEEMNMRFNEQDVERMMTAITAKDPV